MKKLRETLPHFSSWLASMTNKRYSGKKDGAVGQCSCVDVNSESQQHHNIDKKTVHGLVQPAHACMTRHIAVGIRDLEWLEEA